MPTIEYVREAGSEGIDGDEADCARRDGGYRRRPRPKVANRFNDVPASNTAVAPHSGKRSINQALPRIINGKTHQGRAGRRARLRPQAPRRN